MAHETWIQPTPSQFAMISVLMHGHFNCYRYYDSHLVATYFSPQNDIQSVSSRQIKDAVIETLNLKHDLPTLVQDDLAAIFAHTAIWFSSIQIDAPSELSVKSIIDKNLQSFPTYLQCWAFGDADRVRSILSSIYPKDFNKDYLK